MSAHRKLIRQTAARFAALFKTAFARTTQKTFSVARASACVGFGWRKRGMDTTNSTATTPDAPAEKSAQPPLTLRKVKSHAFGKDIYLLGIDKHGDKLWLEAATWDCGWYWGFGYIERYTNNNRPDLAKDISSHTHWDSEIIGKQEYYDCEKQCFRTGTDYIYHLNEHPNIKATTLSDRESWELSDLMKSFYTLKSAAECIGRGSAHVSSTDESANYKDEALAKQINKQMLPKIFARIYALLSPSEAA